MRRLDRAVVLVGVLLTAACGGRQQTRQTMPDERLLACDGLLERLAQVDTSTASESSLESAMNEADGAYSVCADAWRDEAESPADMVFAGHRVAQLELRSLMFEAALSQRFDNMANYCAIVEDLFALILLSLAELENAIVSGDFRGEELRSFEELRDLDLETIDVLLTATAEFCAPQ